MSASALTTTEVEAPFTGMSTKSVPGRGRNDAEERLSVCGCGKGEGRESCWMTLTMGMGHVGEICSKGGGKDYAG